MTSEVGQSHVVNRAKIKGETDHARPALKADSGAQASDSDTPPVDLDWSEAPLVPLLSKALVTLRLDRDLLEWFRAQGKGHQTLINRVLRTYFEAKRQR